MKVIDIKGDIVDNMTGQMYDFFGIDYVSPKSVLDVLDGEEVDDITINVASGGGDVFAASEIYTSLKMYSGNVVVNIQGLAASSASIISMAGDVVNIAPTAQLMIHKASISTGGNSNDLEHQANILSGIDKSIATAYQLKTGKSQEELLNMMSDETWLTAQDAVEQGFADSIMFVDQASPLVTNSFGRIANKEAVNDFMNYIAHKKKLSQPTDNLKSRKLAILLGK